MNVISIRYEIQHGMHLCQVSNSINKRYHTSHLILTIPRYYDTRARLDQYSKHDDSDSNSGNDNDNKMFRQTQYSLIQEFQKQNVTQLPRRSQLSQQEIKLSTVAYHSKSKICLNVSSCSVQFPPTAVI